MLVLFAAVAAFLATAAPGSAAWHQAKTRHFIIFTQQKPAELKAYAERLERFDVGVQTVHAMCDPTSPTAADALRVETGAAPSPALCRLSAGQD